LTDRTSSQGTTVAPGALTNLLRQIIAEPPLPAEPLPPGLRIAQRYEIRRELGRGGFGVVYEARDLVLSRNVAFKALQVDSHPEVPEDSLLREAETAAQLSHPNIVTLHDVGRSEHGPYLVLELLRGSPLATRLGQGALPLVEALRIGTDVARGLAHAHARGVVHRDLSAANVFLCEDGHVKILDFGLAQRFGHRKLDGGTRLYMAPEQLRGAPEDERTDVFALGVIIFQMISGEHPLLGRDLTRLRAHKRLDVAGVPGIGTLLARMLEGDPVERPRDGQEVAEALAALLPGESRSTTSVEVRVRHSTGVRALVSLAVVVAMALAGVAAGVWPRPGAEPRPPVPRIERDETVTITPQPQAPARNVADPPAAPPPPQLRPRGPLRAQVTPATQPPARPARIACRDALDAVPTPPAESGDGVIVIEARPFGDYSIDGLPMGETPGECRVASGTYLVRVEHRTFGSKEARVAVAPGERARWVAVLHEDQ